MTMLNSTYQYIGRSNAVNCPSGWKYYTLLYAKTTGDFTTGKHTVSVKMRIACDTTSSFHLWSTTAFTKVDGVTAFSWNGQQIPSASWNADTLTEGGYTYKRWIDLKEGTVVVNAGFGQAKEITINSSWSLDRTENSPGWLPYQEVPITASIKVTLPMLASASTITNAPDATLKTKCSITWTPQAASFRYRLKFSIGDWEDMTEVIHPNKTTAYTYTGYTFPIEVASRITTRTGTMTATLYTYSDSNASTLVGTSAPKTFTVTVPRVTETNPTISMSLDPVSTLAAPFDSMYIQGKSKVKATLDISTNLGASILESKVTVDGVVYGEPYETGYLTKAGVLTVKGSVKDSREYIVLCSSEINVIQYSKPKIQVVSGESNVVAARCDANGEPSSNGTYLKIKAKIGYEKVIANGVQNNFGKIQYRYKAVGTAPYSEWQTILDTETSESEEIITEPLLNGTLSVKNSYHVQIRAKDYIEESEPITLYVASDTVYMDRPAGGRSMGLGGYSTGAGKLDVYWKTMARGGLSLINNEGDEISVDNTLPLPRGELAEGWSPNAIANGVHVVANGNYPLKNETGNTVVMGNGILIQMSATVNGSMKIQMAFPTDANPPAYRIFQEDQWTPWYTWNTFMI